VRRRILARVIAAAAIVAKVREISQISGSELPAQFDGGKDGAISLAVSARVADLDETP
jgi:hypothetical protein